MPQAAASSALTLAMVSASSSSKVPPMASGMGNTVRMPWITSLMISGGMPWGVWLRMSSTTRAKASGSAPAPQIRLPAEYICSLVRCISAAGPVSEPASVKSEAISA